MVEIGTLINFLNKECFWKCIEDTKKRKIYVATTAISAVFTPQLERSAGTSCTMNVMMIRLRQKTLGEYLTVYINKTYVGGFFPYELIVRNTLEYMDLLMITIRGYSPLESAMFIPEWVPHPLPSTMTEILPTTIWDYSRVMTEEELRELNLQVEREELPKPKKIGRGGAWMSGNQLILAFLDMDLAMCCPEDLIFPSLSTIVNSLTRCTNTECVPCHGHGLHVHVLDGITPECATGSSRTCPCLLSCEGLSSTHVAIRQSRHLLPFLFDQDKTRSIRYIGYTDGQGVLAVEDLIFGVGPGGEHIRCNGNSWKLLKLPPILTRIFLYQCQVMKNICLRSY
ncbi:CETP binding protein [Vombatid gammaherpesvirus 1]|uniref:CETP binding protein n=1 Tax=Vombatid gammaherpesvirus 1 TaxID=2052651 RepID=A0A3Q8J8D4_9GAMA|nr:CETP binding protein [Vombatid gammaherpesvirus 1]AZB49132.1 CETP binding protein [Vombatid gammaherpesvirus 1]